jgi:hypothetical protein
VQFLHPRDKSPEAEEAARRKRGKKKLQTAEELAEARELADAAEAAEWAANEAEQDGRRTGSG